MSGKCLKGLLKVSGMCFQGVLRLSGRCWKGWNCGCGWDTHTSCIRPCRALVNYFVVVACFLVANDDLILDNCAANST